MSDPFLSCDSIFVWAANIQNRLNNDPTRAAFKDYVHVQGIQWLDEYLDNVLTGPKDQPIIELAKTPGRKKDISKKTRAGVAAASAKKQKITNNSREDKENAPIQPNSLRQALLKAQKEPEVDDLPLECRAPLSVSIAIPSPQSKPDHVQQPPLTAGQNLAQKSLLPVLQDQPSQNLSMIQEQEEDVISTPPTRDAEALVPLEKLKDTIQPLPIDSAASTFTASPTVSAAPPSSPKLAVDLPIMGAALKSNSVDKLDVLSMASHPPSQSTSSPEGCAPKPPHSPRLRTVHGSAPTRPTSPQVPISEMPHFASSSGPASAGPGPSSAHDVVVVSAVNPAKPMRSSWLAKGLPTGAKKSMGMTLVAQAKKSLGVGLSAAPVVKRKQDEELSDEEKLQGRSNKALKAAHPSSASGTAPKKAVYEETRAITGTSIGLRVSSRGTLPAQNETDDEDDSATEDDQSLTVHRLAEIVHKSKEQQRTKSFRYGVEIDVTGRFDKVIPPPKSLEYPPVPEATTAAVHPTLSLGSQPNLSSRSYDRLSISELTSSTDSPNGPSQGKGSSSQIAQGLRVSESPFTLLVESTKTSTTPPHSPPKAAKPTAIPPVPQPSRANTSTTRLESATTAMGMTTEQLSQFEAIILGMPISEQVAATTQQQVEVTRDVAVVRNPPSKLPPSPIAQVALSKNPFTVPEPTTAAAPPANPWAIPDDLFAQPPALKAQPAGPPLASQSSTITVSSQGSYNDSLFSQPPNRYASTMDSEYGTQPTDYGMSQETQPAVDVKGKGKALVENVFPARSAGQAIVTAAAVVDAGQAGIEVEESLQINSLSTEHEITTSTSGIGAALYSSAVNFVAKTFGSAKKPAKADHLKALEAAAAAKKEHEEKDKKAIKTREVMKQRTATTSMAFSQKKQLDTDKLKKDDGQKRKREKEESNLPKPAGKPKKIEDESFKKQKLSAAPEHKVDLRKPSSKDKLNISYQAQASATSVRVLPRPASQASQYPISKQTSKSIMKKPSGNLGGSSQPSAAGPSFSKLPPAFGQPSSSQPAGTARAASKAGPEAGPSSNARQQPAQVLRADMQARIQAQIAARNQEEAIASEQIELPEINSEYSDSDDEDRKKDLPHWATSPEIRKQLHEQRSINPDDLFGPVPTLNMGEVFVGARQSRFRPRTSSANWHGADGLTQLEELEYARRMGFTITKK